MADPSPGSARWLEAQRDRLAATAVERQYERQPALAARYGPGGRAKCLQDAAYHLRYLAEAVAAGAPALFDEYVAWAKVLLVARDVPADDLALQLEILEEVIAAELDGDAGAAREMLAAARAALPSMPSEAPSYLDGDGELPALARAYLADLLGGDRRAALARVLAAADAGHGVLELYSGVFAPVQREIGRRWQLGEATVAQEHFVSAATQLVMAQLYPRILDVAPRGPTVVIVCVGSELHEIGARMVADAFELAGWDSHYLGANTPAGDVVDLLARQGAALLAVSTTMTYHLERTRALIAAVRAAEVLSTVKVLVGGRPFLLAPELAGRLGADAVAFDAGEAVQVGADLVGREDERGG